MSTWKLAREVLSAELEGGSVHVEEEEAWRPSSASSRPTCHLAAFPVAAVTVEVGDGRHTLRWTSLWACLSQGSAVRLCTLDALVTLADASSSCVLKLPATVLLSRRVWP